MINSKFEDRVRFNWGYHDAQSFAGRDLLTGKSVNGEEWAKDHFDKAYGKGFLFGLADKQAATYAGNSDAAWAAHRAEEKAAQDQRRALKAMRFDSRVTRY